MAKIQTVIVDIDLCSSPEMPDTDGTPLRPIYCVKKRENMKKLEEREECFILDFDPDDDGSFDISEKLSVKKNLESTFASDVSVVAEKGQVACRDFPHPRNVCVKFPFGKTTHESYCGLCYCYVCDVPAPCEKWIGLSGHCHAINNDAWKLQRRVMKKAS